MNQNPSDRRADGGLIPARHSVSNTFLGNSRSATTRHATQSNCAADVEHKRQTAKDMEMNATTGSIRSILDFADRFEP